MWLAAAYNVQLEILLCSTKVDLISSAIGDYFLEPFFVGTKCLLAWILWEYLRMKCLSTTEHPSRWYCFLSFLTRWKKHGTSFYSVKSLVTASPSLWVTRCLPVWAVEPSAPPLAFPPRFPPQHLRVLWRPVRAVAMTPQILRAWWIGRKSWPPRYNIREAVWV